MRSLLLIAAATALAACSADPDDSPEAPDGRVAAPVFAGLDLSRPVRLIGTEPFWGIQLTGAELIYSGVDRPEQRAPQPQPLIQGTVATLETTTSAGTEIAITLTATECSDGMSDRTYPVTALVEIGGETLMGCAASAATIMSAGESGAMLEPRDQPPA